MRTNDLSRPAKRRRRTKYTTEVSEESRYITIANQQRNVGIYSGETFSSSDTLYVNPQDSGIDTEDSCCTHNGYVSGDKEDFLTGLGYKKVTIVTSRNSDSIVEDTFDYS